MSDLLWVVGLLGFMQGCTIVLVWHLWRWRKAADARIVLLMTTTNTLLTEMSHQIDREMERL